MDPSPGSVPDVQSPYQFDPEVELPSLSKVKLKFTVKLKNIPSRIRPDAKGEFRPAVCFFRPHATEHRLVPIACTAVAAALTKDNQGGLPATRGEVNYDDCVHLHYYQPDSVREWHSTEEEETVLAMNTCMAQVIDVSGSTDIQKCIEQRVEEGRVFGSCAIVLQDAIQLRGAEYDLFSPATGEVLTLGEGPQVCRLELVLVEDRLTATPFKELYEGALLAIDSSSSSMSPVSPSSTSPSASANINGVNGNGRRASLFLKAAESPTASLPALTDGLPGTLPLSEQGVLTLTVSAPQSQEDPSHSHVSAEVMMNGMVLDEPQDRLWKYFTQPQCPLLDGAMALVRQMDRRQSDSLFPTVYCKDYVPKLNASTTMTHPTDSTGPTTENKTGEAQHGDGSVPVNGWNADECLTHEHRHATPHDDERVLQIVLSLGDAMAKSSGGSSTSNTDNNSEGATTPNNNPSAPLFIPRSWDHLREQIRNVLRTQGLYPSDVPLEDDISISRSHSHLGTTISGQGTGGGGGNGSPSRRSSHALSTGMGSSGTSVTFVSSVTNQYTSPPGTQGDAKEGEREGDMAGSGDPLSPGLSNEAAGRGSGSGSGGTRRASIVRLPGGHVDLVALAKAETERVTLEEMRRSSTTNNTPLNSGRRASADIGIVSPSGLVSTPFTSGGVAGGSNASGGRRESRRASDAALTLSPSAYHSNRGSIVNNTLVPQGSARGSLSPQTDNTTINENNNSNFNTINDENKDDIHVHGVPPVFTIVIQDPEPQPNSELMTNETTDTTTEGTGTMNTTDTSSDTNTNTNTNTSVRNSNVVSGNEHLYQSSPNPQTSPPLATTVSTPTTSSSADASSTTGTSGTSGTKAVTSQTSSSSSPSPSPTSSSSSSPTPRRPSFRSSVSQSQQQQQQQPQPPQVQPVSPRPPKLSRRASTNSTIASHNNNNNNNTNSLHSSTTHGTDSQQRLEKRRSVDSMPSSSPSSTTNFATPNATARPPTSTNSSASSYPTLAAGTPQAPDSLPASAFVDPPSPSFTYPHTSAPTPYIISPPTTSSSSSTNPESMDRLIERRLSSAALTLHQRQAFELSQECARLRDDVSHLNAKLKHKHEEIERLAAEKDKLIREKDLLLRKVESVETDMQAIKEKSNQVRKETEAREIATVLRAASARDRAAAVMSRAVTLMARHKLGRVMGYLGMVSAWIKRYTVKKRLLTWGMTMFAYLEKLDKESRLLTASTADRPLSPLDAPDYASLLVSLCNDPSVLQKKDEDDSNAMYSYMQRGAGVLRLGNGLEVLVVGGQDALPSTATKSSSTRERERERAEDKDPLSTFKYKISSVPLDAILAANQSVWRDITELLQAIVNQKHFWYRTAKSFSYRGLEAADKLNQQQQQQQQQPFNNGTSSINNSATMNHPNNQNSNPTNTNRHNHNGTTNDTGHSNGSADASGKRDGRKLSEYSSSGDGDEQTSSPAVREGMVTMKEVEQLTNELRRQTRQAVNEVEIELERERKKVMALKRQARVVQADNERYMQRITDLRAYISEIQHMFVNQLISLGADPASIKLPPPPITPAVPSAYYCSPDTNRTPERDRGTPGHGVYTARASDEEGMTQGSLDHVARPMAVLRSGSAGSLVDPYSTSSASPSSTSYAPPFLSSRERTLREQRQLDRAARLDASEPFSLPQINRGDYVHNHSLSPAISTSTSRLSSSKPSRDVLRGLDTSRVPGAGAYRVPVGPVPGTLATTTGPTSPQSATQGTGQLSHTNYNTGTTNGTMGTSSVRLSKGMLKLSRMLKDQEKAITLGTTK